MNLAARCQQIDSSGIRKIFDLATTLKDPVNLSIGLPDFDVPNPVKEEAILHIQMGHNRYTPSAGLPELREKMKNHLKSRGLFVEDLLITSGVSGGLFLSLLALLNAGETALVSDPYFVIYKELPTLLGAKIQYLDTYPDFRLTPEQLRKVITPECKILFLNNPANPTGRILSRETLKQIAEVLKGSGIWVISDEIYDAFDFEGQHSFFGSLYEKTVTLGGFSKTSGMTGWRVGYAAGPKELIEAMIKIQQYTFVCAPSFAQYASLKALDLSLLELRDTYRKKRDFVMDALKDHYEMQKPDGAFYIFMKHPKWDGNRLAQEAIKKEVLLVPGSIFSTRNTHFRLSFANTDTMLQKGVDRLRSLSHE